MTSVIRTFEGLSPNRVSLIFDEKRIRFSTPPVFYGLNLFSDLPNFTPRRPIVVAFVGGWGSPSYGASGYGVRDFFFFLRALFLR